MDEGEVVLTYAQESDAAEAMRALNERGIDDYRLVIIEDSSPEDQETTVIAGPGVAMTGPQGRGAAMGALAGGSLLGLFGAIVALALRALALIALPVAWAIIASSIAAGATAGSVYGGRLGGVADAMRHQEMQDLRFVLRVTPHDRSQAVRARQILMRTRYTASW